MSKSGSDATGTIEVNFNTTQVLLVTIAGMEKRKLIIASIPKIRGN
jgi:hypothetical protein